MKTSKDTPLNEITLRRYEKTQELTERGLARKICLSMGVLQPGDSRDIIVDIFLCLLKANKPISSQELEEEVKKARKLAKLPMLGVAGSNIRRQVRRLREVFLAEKINNRYRITENLPLVEIYDSKVEKILLAEISSRIREELAKADGMFKRQ